MPKRHSVPGSVPSVGARGALRAALLIVLVSSAVQTVNVGAAPAPANGVVAAALPDRPALIPDADVPARIDAYIAPYVEARDFSGAVLIARDGKILFRKAYGMANYELAVPNAPDTKFHVASVTKPITATLILRLEQAGLLSISDPVSRFVPDYPRGDDITLHHVLTHRSGIPNYNRFPDYDAMMQKRVTLEDTVAWYKHEPLRFEPGSRYEYSNSGYTLLGYVIERVTGKSYEEVLQEHITKPLGMENTGNFPEEWVVAGRAAGYEPGEGWAGLVNGQHYDRSAKRGAGSLWSTVDDLYRFEQALYGEALLTNASKKKAFERHFGGSYGYGWGIDTKHGRTEIAHDGKAPGYIAQIIRYPEERLSIVFAGNIYSGLMNFFARDLPAILFGSPTAAPPAPRPVAVPADVLDRYVGEYEFPASANSLRFRITRRDNSLYVGFLPTARQQYLTPISSTEFMLRSRYDILSFVADSTGRIGHVRYQEPAYEVENLCARVE